MSFLHLVKTAVLMVVPAWASYYLFTYGLWAWREGRKRGAVGAFFLVAVTFGLSLGVIGTR